MSEDTLPKERKEYKKTGFGGSEIAAICGLSRWKKPHDVWADRVLGPQEATGHNIERGNRLEAALREWGADKIGRKVLPCNTTYQGKDPICFATPDGWLADPRDGIVEIKSPSRNTEDEWRDDDGELIIPDAYVCQMQWQMYAVRNTHQVSKSVMFALLDGDLFYKWLPYDEDLVRGLLDKANDFKARYIDIRKPPPPTADRSYGDVLARLFGRNRGEMIDGSNEQYLMARDLAHAKQQEKDAKELITALQNELKLAIGDNDGLQWDGGKVTWRNNKDVVWTDYKGIAENLLGKMSSAERERWVSEYTKTKPGPRVFRVNIKEGK